MHKRKFKIRIQEKERKAQNIIIEDYICLHI